MTREDIIRMAREAGFQEYLLRVYRAEEGVERFAALIATAKDAEHQQTLALQQRSYEREIEIEVEAEREACAKVCEEIDIEGRRGASWDMGTIDCAAAIRARSNK